MSCLSFFRQLWLAVEFHCRLQIHSGLRTSPVGKTFRKSQIFLVYCTRIRAPLQVCDKQKDPSANEGYVTVKT